ncbi:hypothetical protein H1Q59_03105 [Holosporaceae bacterium 'Namur']|nr:hypothetical protein [Holosporaceae bacterium 'Namur']
MTKCIKFTGGENLNGIQKIYHEVLMKNELINGCGAYELSWAGTPTTPGKSAPSFGGNQMDIGGNPEARNVLLNIILNAKHDNHKLFFSNEERK